MALFCGAGVAAASARVLLPEGVGVDVVVVVVVVAAAVVLAVDGAPALLLMRA